MKALLCAALFIVSAAAGAAELRDLTWIGFKNVPGSSRIFVRTTEPAQYKVTDRGDVVIVDLFDTRITAKNFARSLDTSAFDSPVLAVKADELEGASKQVRVEIKLRAKTAYEVKQEDRELSLDFKR